MPTQAAKMPIALVREADRPDAEAVAERAIAARAQGEKSSWEEADCYLDLSVRGWTQQRIAERCGTKQPRVSKFIACATKYSHGNNRPSFFDAYQEVNSANPNHRAEGTGENEWYTPPEYIEAARRAMGGIDLDPASSDMAQLSVRAAEHFTVDDDGLTQDWHGRVWLNPPYAQPLIQEFIEKAVKEYSAGRVSEAIILTHNYTDTAWFHLAAAASEAIVFTKGRIGFLSPEGKRASATQGQAFFYLGPSAERFAAEFSVFGFIARPG